MQALARAATVGNLAGAWGSRSEEAPIVAELKAGSEEAYAWLIAHYHQPVYSLIYRMVNDPADAADTTQEVFLKVFRNIKRFNGQASLKTWMYRIAVHEASNQRRWWSRHKGRESSLAQGEKDSSERGAAGLEATLADAGEGPFDLMAHEEVRARVEWELKQVPEPYRTAVVLRDIEGLSYEEVSEVLQVTMGTVKSRLIRGREALKQRLRPYVAAAGPELGLAEGDGARRKRAKVAASGLGTAMEAEVAGRR